MSYPEASLKVTGSSRTGNLLCPQHEDTVFLLALIAAGRAEQFDITLGEGAAETSGVMLRYPLEFSLDSILADLRKEVYIQRESRQQGTNVPGCGEFRGWTPGLSRSGLVGWVLRQEVHP